MPVSITNLTSGSSTTNGTSFTTASVSVTAGRGLLVSFSAQSVTAGQNANASSISGAGVTCASELSENGSSGYGVVGLWRGAVTSSSSGTITITFPNTMDLCNWSVDEVSDTDTGGTAASNMIVQSVPNHGTAGTSISATLAAFGSANNGTFSSQGNHNISTADGGTWTPGTGFTELSDNAANDSSYGSSLETQWRNDNDTSVDATCSRSGDAKQIVAAEIKYLAGSITSSGTLDSQVATLSGIADVEKTSTGALTSGDASVDGAAARVCASTGALTSAAADMSGVAVREETSQGTLASGESTMTGEAQTAGVFNSSGVLAAADASISGSGYRTLKVSAAIVSGDADISGIAVRGLISSGTLASGDGGVSGVGERVVVGTGAMISGDADMTGIAGIAGVIGAGGTLESGPASMSGTADTLFQIPYPYAKGMIRRMGRMMGAG